MVVQHAGGHAVPREGDRPCEMFPAGTTGSSPARARHYHITGVQAAGGKPGYRLLISCTMSTKATALSTGVCCNTP